MRAKANSLRRRRRRIAVPDAKRANETEAADQAAARLGQSPDWYSGDGRPSIFNGGGGASCVAPVVTRTRWHLTGLDAMFAVTGPCDAFPPAVDRTHRQAYGRWVSPILTEDRGGRDGCSSTEGSSSAPHRARHQAEIAVHSLSRLPPRGARPGQSRAQRIRRAAGLFADDRAGGAPVRAPARRLRARSAGAGSGGVPPVHAGWAISAARLTPVHGNWRTAGPPVHLSCILIRPKA